MKINFADDIKHRITAKELFQYYGFQINRAGFCLSPFSNEKTPSLKVYDGIRGWHDFSSAQGGDVITFVQRYFGLDFHGACEKINNDFRLGLPIGKQLNLLEYRAAEQAVKERRERIEKEKAERQALTDAYHAALDQYVILDRHRTEYAPERMGGALNEFYVEAIKDISFAEYQLAEAEMRLYEYEHNRQ